MGGTTDPSGAYQYLPLSEVTDGHVLAFQLAYDAGDAYEGVMQADRVRAGLAAVQWPVRDVAKLDPSLESDLRTTIADLRKQGRIQAYELTRRAGVIDELQALVARMEKAAADADDESSRHIREITECEDIRDGDTVTVVGRLDNGRPQSVKGFILLSGPGMPVPYRSSSNYVVLSDATFTVHRAVAPLPDKPGSVGTATVQGVKGVRVFLVDPESSEPWCSVGNFVEDYHWHAASDLSDYQQLLDGQPIAEETS